MAIETSRAIASDYDVWEDWDSDFAWALPEGHVLIEAREVTCHDREHLKHHEYEVELVHAPEREALAYYCKRAGCAFVPAEVK